MNIEWKGGAAMERVWLLMTRKMAGEAAEDELQELNDLLRQDPSLQYAFAVTQGLDCREREAVSSGEEKYLLQRGLASIEEFMEEEKKVQPALPGWRPRSPERMLLIIAAALLVILAGGYALWSSIGG